MSSEMRSTFSIKRSGFTRLMVMHGVLALCFSNIKFTSRDDSRGSDEISRHSFLVKRCLSSNVGSRSVPSMSDPVGKALCKSRGDCMLESERELLRLTGFDSVGVDFR